MSGDLVLANALIVTRHETFRGTVARRGRAHRRARSRGRHARRVRDLEGDYLIPGLVELHTDKLERHAAPRPGVRWPGVAAVLAHDGADRRGRHHHRARRARRRLRGRHRAAAPGSAARCVEAIRAAQQQRMLRAEHLLHLRCEVSTELVLEDFARLAEDPLLRLVSLMDHSARAAPVRQRGQVPRVQPRALRALRGAARRADRGARERPRRASAIDTGRRSSPSARSTASRSRATTTPRGPTWRRRSRAAPPSRSSRPRSRPRGPRARFGLAIVAGAPNLVRGESHSGNVSVAELAAASLVDVLSSDYFPSSALHGALLLHQRHGLSLPGGHRHRHRDAGPTGGPGRPRRDRARPARRSRADAGGRRPPHRRRRLARGPAHRVAAPGSAMPVPPWPMLWIAAAVVCLAALSVACWRWLRPPTCRECGAPMPIVSETVVNGMPPAVETLYRCRGCGEVVAQRTVGAWD